MSFPRVILAGFMMGMAHGALAIDFRPIAGVEHTTLTGWVQDGSTEVNLDSDLGLDKSSVSMLGFQVGVLGQRLSFRYVPYSFSGQNDLSRQIDFADSHFAPNSTIRSSLDMIEYAVDYRFVPINTPIGYVGAGVGVNLFEADVKLNSGTAEAMSSGSLPLPTVGVTAGLKFPLSDLSLNGDYSMMSYDNNRYRNLELNLDYKPFPLVGFRLGFRHRELELDDDDLKAELSMKGPFVAVWVGL